MIDINSVREMLKMEKKTVGIKRSIKSYFSISFLCAIEVIYLQCDFFQLRTASYCHCGVTVSWKTLIRLLSKKKQTHAHAHGGRVWDRVAQVPVQGNSL